ncbi:MAG: hypothetical protein ACP6IY_20740 [Promethearchaeia archaeon]
MKFRNIIKFFKKNKIFRIIIEIIPKKIRKLKNYLPIRTKYTGNPREPWYTRDSIIFLNKYMKPNFIGFEFGSGASTLWFAKRIKYLISIEHSEFWYKNVLEKLKKKKIDNVTLKLIPLERDLNKDKYSNYINKFPNNYFDIILIDGRNRVNCIKNSINKLKKGGFLVLDNSERKRYEDGIKLLKNWIEIKTTNGRWDTTIWIKN